MRTKITLFTILIGGLSLSSCTKDYTCSCDIGFTDPFAVDYNDLRKKDAKEVGDICESESGCTWILK